MTHTKPLSGSCHKALLPGSTYCSPSPRVLPFNCLIRRRETRICDKAASLPDGSSGVRDRGHFEMHAGLLLQHTDHAEQICRRRVALSAEHSHEALGWRLRREREAL